jgi:hypothetical protein
MTNTTNQNRPTGRLAVIGALGTSTLLGSLGILAPQEANAYVASWTRTDAYNLAQTGLGESYGGGGTGNSSWNDNNIQDDIGADCSGYAGKAWQIAGTTVVPMGTNTYQTDTASIWNGNVSAAYNISMTDSRTRKMDFWVKRKVDNSGGHMGLFSGSTAAAGNYKVWHASQTGVPISGEEKPFAYFAGDATWQTAKRYKRVNW